MNSAIILGLIVHVGVAVLFWKTLNVKTDP